MPLDLHELISRILILAGEEANSPPERAWGPKSSGTAVTLWSRNAAEGAHRWFSGRPSDRISTSPLDFLALRRNYPFAPFIEVPTRRGVRMQVLSGAIRKTSPPHTKAGLQREGCRLQRES